MKFKVEQVAKETEESVNVYCYDPQEDWVNKVQEAALGQVVVCGNMEGEIHQVRLAEIYYFEVVDGSSFIYTKRDIEQAVQRQKENVALRKTQY